LQELDFENMEQAYFAWNRHILPDLNLPFGQGNKSNGTTFCKNCPNTDLHIITVTTKSIQQLIIFQIIIAKLYLPIAALLFNKVMRSLLCATSNPPHLLKPVNSN